MTESEFLAETDRIFLHIQHRIDEAGWDMDTLQQGSVLDIELDSGEHIIINRHTPSQELWIAAKRGGFHFAYRNGQWLDTRDGSEFFHRLSEIITPSGCELFRF